MTITSAAARNFMLAAVTPIVLTVAMLTAAVAEPAIESRAHTESRTHQIAIAYETPTNPAHEALRDLLVSARVLEHVQEILSVFRLRKPLPISIESCDGDPDARYVYSEARIKVCYEYIAEIWQDLPAGTTPAGVAPIDAVVGPLADVFFHEFGHALIDQYRIPVLGREEYAADTVSALLMLKLAKDESRRLIMGAAYWYTDDLETTVTLKPTDFSSVHGTPHQRFFNLLCIAYGANQEIFGDLVTKGFLPEERAVDCKSEFEQATHAFDVLIRPHMDETLANDVFGKRWLPDVGIYPAALFKPGTGSRDDVPSTN